MGTEVYRLFLITNINNINDINNSGVIIFNFKKGGDLHQHMITHMSRFFCFWYSTIVSSSHLTPPFTRYPEFSNGRYSTTRNQVTGCSQDRIRTYVTTSLYGVVLTITPPDYIFGGDYGSRTRSERRDRATS